MAACDRVIVLNEGKIVLDGEYKELIKNADFQEVVD